MSSLCVSLWEQLAFHQLCRLSFLMLSMMPRTSPPFRWHPKPANQSSALNSIRFDWLAIKAKRPFSGCSFPYRVLTSPEPEAFLQPLTTLGVYLSLLCVCVCVSVNAPCDLCTGRTVINPLKLNCDQGTVTQGEGERGYRVWENIKTPWGEHSLLLVTQFPWLRVNVYTSCLALGLFNTLPCCCDTCLCSSHGAQC